MEKFIIDYNGVVFTEPNMLLSNWAITILCLVCIYQLQGFITTTSIRFYKIVFIMNGIGAFMGGLAHLLYLYTGQPLKTFAWIFVGLGTYFLQRTALELVGKTNLKAPLLIFSHIKLVLFIIGLLYFQSFFIVLADLALGLFLVVVPVHIGQYLTTRNRGSWLTLLAVIIILFSSVFPIFRLSIHENWFTFNDIGHLLMAASLYVIYLGAEY